jgi:hypothetical protein
MLKIKTTPAYHQVIKHMLLGKTIADAPRWQAIPYGLIPNIHL